MNVPVSLELIMIRLDISPLVSWLDYVLQNVVHCM